MMRSRLFKTAYITVIATFIIVCIASPILLSILPKAPPTNQYPHREVDEPTISVEIQQSDVDNLLNKLDEFIPFGNYSDIIGSDEMSPADKYEAIMQYAYDHNIDLIDQAMLQKHGKNLIDSRVNQILESNLSKAEQHQAIDILDSIDITAVMAQYPTYSAFNADSIEFFKNSLQQSTGNQATNNSTLRACNNSYQ